MIDLQCFPSAEEATHAAAKQLAACLTDPAVKNVMLAAGNTPLPLYREIGAMGLDLVHLGLFALDEYVGVPTTEPRNCANLIRHTAVEPWKVPLGNYFTISSDPAEAEASAREQEDRIEALGGLDVIVLGLGQNGHLGFNEPGSAQDCGARMLALDEISIEANGQWFSGDYAPAFGATVGLRTILSAKRIFILAFGPRKAAAVQAMLQPPPTELCPASFLQLHRQVSLFLDSGASRRIVSASTLG